MDQLKAEQRLTIIYVLTSIFGAVASITSGIAWGHWKQTLDQCIGRNCSCILFGEHTPSKFLGGSNGYCIWVTFGPLFLVFFCVGLTCFHGYRVLFSSRAPPSRKTRSVVAKLEPGENVLITAVSQESTSPLPRAYWIIVAVFSVISTIYAIIHFSVFVQGFYKTCNQYRLELENKFPVGGSALPVIHGRLSCQGIFDFMDYFEMDSGNAYRGGFINTGLDLILGIIGAAFTWMLFLLASYINIKMVQASGHEE
ncbi:unnamed protein product [Brassicogethes aeneus]|uniref:Uncharacterized protein n=1 Tax=Brassicogethes aeneus TaxID=1431903 RepID=A0A9P0AQF2_BRAAE|nr:unnamed protein product [Brassicogethes aeneus]